MALQKTTEDKLRFLHMFLTDNKHEQEAKLIIEIIRAECRTKRSTHFSLYDFVKRDNPYSPMTGIHYKDGMQVATDGHVLVLLKEEYDSELEGKTINKDGEEEPGKYPDYMSVIPDSLDEFKPYEIDAEKFFEWLDERKADFKMKHGGRGVKFCDDWFVKIGGALFKAEIFSKVIKAGKEIGSLVLYIKDGAHGAVIQTEAGTVLAMPWFATESENVLTL